MEAFVVMKEQIKNKSLSDLKWIPYLLSLMGAIAVSQFFSLKTSSQFTLIFALLMFPLFKKRYSEYNGYEAPACICAILFSLFTVSSALIRSENGYVYMSFCKVESFPPLIAYFIMFFFLFEALCQILFKSMSTVSLSEKTAEPPLKNKLIVFCGTMLLMLIMWLPFLLYAYPCVITRDSICQLEQATGRTALSNHHPVVHTMLIKLTYYLGQRLFDGDDTKSVLVYSVTQQLFLSACFAYLIETFYKFRAKKVVIICTLLFYGLSVYHALYSVTMWKDIWYGGIIAVFTALIWRLLNKGERFKLSITEAVMVFIFSAGMCLMRSNGLFAFALLLLISIFVLFKRNKTTLGIMLLALVTSLVIKGPVYDSIGVKPVDTIEALSIPAQQIAAVASLPADLTSEQRELLENVVDVDRIADLYQPYISDPIKELVRGKGNQEYIKEHKLEFLSLWFSLGLHHPQKYLRAYAEQTCGYWYPDVQNFVTTSVCFTDGFDFKKESKAGILTDFLSYYQYSYIETPILGLLSSVGLGMWVMIFMAAAAVRKHGKKVILVYIPVIGTMLTLLIATPDYCDLRYAYALFTALPMLCAVPFIDIRAAKAPLSAEPAKATDEKKDEKPDTK